MKSSTSKVKSTISDYQRHYAEMIAVEENKSKVERNDTYKIHETIYILKKVSKFTIRKVYTVHTKNDIK